MINLHVTIQQVGTDVSARFEADMHVGTYTPYEARVLRRVTNAIHAEMMLILAADADRGLVVDRSNLDATGERER